MWYIIVIVVLFLVFFYFDRVMKAQDEQRTRREIERFYRKCEEKVELACLGALEAIDYDGVNTYTVHRKVVTENKNRMDLFHVKMSPEILIATGFKSKDMESYFTHSEWIFLMNLPDENDK